MIDHISLVVTDYEKSKSFYQAALKPIGYSMLVEFGPQQTGGTAVCGFGAGQKPDVWLTQGTISSPPPHVALGVDKRELVDAFHQAALAAGATDNGAPGPRPMYHPGYYGAFVRDRDGNNFEVVCHKP